MKRTIYRKSGEQSHLEPEATKLFNLRQEDVLGWFATKQNIAFGWCLINTTDAEKEEFGSDALRTYSYRTESTCIVKINPEKGTYAFIDNEAYTNGEIKFDKMTPYNRLVVDVTENHEALMMKILNVCSL